MKLTKEQIKIAALDSGFKLKQQPSGVMDLNPYVYEFARALTEPLRIENEQLKAQIEPFKELARAYRKNRFKGDSDDKP
jgi:hypothetical protein